MQREQDLTRGRPAATLPAFYFPLLLTNLCQQMYAFCDALVVGRELGDAALAAVGNLAPLTLVIAGFCTGLTGGFAVPIAQRCGAKDMPALRRNVAAAARLCAALALRGAQPVALCTGYLRVCGAALIPLGWMFVLRGAVQGLGRPLVPMASGLLEMAIRIGVIAALLPRFGFGVAAAANVVAWLGALALNGASYARWLRAGEH